MRGLRSVQYGVLVLLAAAAMHLSSCKKEEGFKIEGKWRVESVSRQGLPIEDHAIKSGDMYEFKAKGEYSFSGDQPRSGKYEFNLEEKRLVLDGEEYFVYTASGKELTFGLLQQKEDIYTVALRAER